MTSEIILKQNNQTLTNLNVFDKLVNVKELKNVIQQNLSKNDELYFIDEINDIIYNIGEKALNTIKDKINATEGLKREYIAQYTDNINFLIKFRNYEFAECSINAQTFYDIFQNIDITQEIKIIQNAIEKLRFVLLPVGLIGDTSEQMAFKVIARLIVNTNFYGKKDDEMITKNAKAISADLQEYSFYAIKRGVAQYCKNHKDYPALKDLIDAIEPFQEKGLKLFANVQFLLNLNDVN